MRLWDAKASTSHQFARSSLLRRIHPARSVGLRIHVRVTNQRVAAHARLDVPTFDDSEVRSLLETVASDRSGPWEALSESFNIGSIGLELFAEALVLWKIIMDSSDSLLLAVLCLIGPLASWWSRDIRRPDGGKVI